MKQITGRIAAGACGLGGAVGVVVGSTGAFGVAAAVWVGAVASLTVLAVPLGLRRLFHELRGTWTLERATERTQHVVGLELAGTSLLFLGAGSLGLCLALGSEDALRSWPLVLMVIATVVGVPVVLFGSGLDAAEALGERVGQRRRCLARRGQAGAGALSEVDAGGALSWPEAGR